MRRAAIGRGGKMKKSIVRNASKSMEKKTVSQAKKIFNNPFQVLPTLKDKDSKKAFKKTRKQINKVEKNKDDTKKLEKLANKRNLAGAVAGTMLIAHAEKAPFLAAASLPSGQVTYAQRGNASKEQLIAVQNSDDPFLRVLGIRDIALKQQIHIYSWDNGFLSSGKKREPPHDFVSFVLNKAHLKRKNDTAICPHLSEKIVQQKKNADQPYIYFHWKSASLTIGVCERCAQKKKNTLFTITKYLIDPAVADDFSVSVVGELIKGEDQSSVSSFFIDDYFSGNITDDALIEKNMKKRMENLKETDENLFVLDQQSFGSDVDAFISSLDPNEAESYALSFILKRIKHPVIVKNATPNTVLELFWTDYAEELLSSIVDDEKIVSELRSLNETPSSIVETALTYKKREDVLSQLPSYKDLPSLARFADQLARVYKTQGKKKVLTELKHGPDDTKAKSISYAFLLALDEASDKKWKYSKVEIESGEFLKQLITELLQSTAEEYHQALQQVVNASGQSEDLSSYRKK